MSTPRPPKRTIVKAPVISFREIIEGQLAALAALAGGRLLDKEELQVFKTITEAYVTLGPDERHNLSSSSIVVPEQETVRDISELLKLASQPVKR
jgi:hypothetical protein